MVTVAYNGYCVISKEGDDDTYDGKTVGSRSWEVGTTVNSLVVTLFHVIITRTGTDLIFLSRLGSTICFTNFGSHDPIVLYWNPWYTEPCYKGSLLYINIDFTFYVNETLLNASHLSISATDAATTTQDPIRHRVVEGNGHHLICRYERN